ncbi:hypothetical protein BOTBODRAFT_33233 [Botryobasidium botryosum FD-172 SS1]|uniref:F-box domain-containing protein n=1 Tax=Botryobasidium botryosum (strain FD-172 SS1) TaxID=930990 RepID=A0A067MPK8_BOTB1|nr:hypothetical protein BOTBODRAFT_33233 [Botryobasidium botryosum FD-172 SS1]
MPTLADVPVETLVDNFVPFLDLRDLLALSCCNKFFAAVCADDLLWKRKLRTEYNFTIADARDTGFKRIYKGIRNPKVFVWGDYGQHRLGLPESITKEKFRGMGGVPYPHELQIDARVVALAAGGWSFHALDDAGNIHVWGRLSGEGLIGTDDGEFYDPAQVARTPHRLELPTSFRSISCGRALMVALDAQSHVWVFRSWGSPFRLAPSMFGSDRVVQVEAGWEFASILTESGSVYAVWPFDGKLQDLTVVREMHIESEENTDDTPKAIARDNVIPCAHWEADIIPLELPRLPKLPVLSRDESGTAEAEPRVVKIAAGDQFLVALTNQGHVLKFNLRNYVDVEVDENDDDNLPTMFVEGPEKPTWEYLPAFSEADQVRSQPAFSGQDKVVPDKLKFNHISAHFKTFFAYSTGAHSVVLIGKNETTARDAPHIIPSLQNRSVVSVVLGDYHFGALTSGGELFTWGQYSNGALGLGDPHDIPYGTPGGYATTGHRGRVTDVVEPTRVRFDWDEGEGSSAEGRRGEKFCFAATASGWHVGALVIELKGDGPEGGARKEAHSPKRRKTEEGAKPGPSGGGSQAEQSHAYESPPFLPFIMRRGLAAGPMGPGARAGRARGEVTEPPAE